MTSHSFSTEPDAVRLAGVSRSYGPVRAVDHLDLAIASGETVALLGPNGAGKSTSIDMLLGLARPDAGEVALYGLSPRQAIAKGWIGAMLQSGMPLNDLSVREYLTMLAGLFPDPLRRDEAMEMAGVASLASRRTQRLSGGESQRVRFAATIISDPRLIVLDEPTVAMDVESRRGFWDAMRTFTDRGRTVLSSPPTTWKRPTPSPTAWS